MKEQNKKGEKLNNGFFRWLIIEYLRVFISILIRNLVDLGYYPRRKKQMDVANGWIWWQNGGIFLKFRGIIFFVR
jgi:hypothetical protein